MDPPNRDPKEVRLEKAEMSPQDRAEKKPGMQ